MIREDRRSWVSASLACLLNMIGMPHEVMIGRSVRGMPIGPPIACFIVGAVLLGVLVARRTTMTRAQAGIVFLVNTTAIIVMLWIGADHYAELGPRWAPFQANKLGALAVAMLAPDLGVGLLSIAAYVGSASLQFALFAPAIRSRLPTGEPWATIAFGVFAVALHIHHVRRFALERQLSEVEANAATLATLARASLAVRDLANTPLQNITLAVGLLRARSGNEEAALDVIERAASHLHQLGRVLEEHASHRRPHDLDASFDALERLKRVPSGGGAP